MELENHPRFRGDMRGEGAGVADDKLVSFQAAAHANARD